jgi:tetratricopeptide (TPR) repeat protein
MKTLRVRVIALTLAISTTFSQGWSTCGGGGGGGTGGMTSIGPMGAGTGMQEPMYIVPWRVRMPEAPPITDGLVVYWFPSSVQEVQKSSLRVSRLLSLYASQCVAMEIVDAATSLGQKLIPDAKLPIAVLATPDGSAIGKAENKNGFLRVDQVEKLVDEEYKRRENQVESQLKAAKEHVKSGDTAGAIPLYKPVLDQKCLFPRKAKDAAKALKKLGVAEAAGLADTSDFPSPIFDRVIGAKIERIMKEGLRAENSAHYREAERLYTLAHNMDPADPTPLRYLGEVYRHEIGNWEKAHEMFDAILAMPSDPIARAIALHGNGKMTIHEGDSKKGLALLEQSVATFPTALAYRNLAVYWNSEGDGSKTNLYVHKALDLEPHDAYNLVFAAAFMAGTGRGEEALKIARANEGMLPASYNLAAIYAQLGQRDKALSLLRRHFFQYERYESVRAREMMEARVDAVFATVMHDPEFLALTKGADGRLAIPEQKTMNHNGSSVF